ncbi:MAG: chemotaxis protein CheA [Candidatus Zixiibacteriota bacterium]
MNEPILNINPEMFAEFIDEALEMLQKIDNELVELEKNPNDLEIIKKVFRPIHTIKGNSTFFNLLKVKKLAHTLENQFDLMRKGKLIPNKSNVSVLLEGIDELKKMLQRVRGGDNEIDDEDKYKGLLDKLEDSAFGADKDRLWEIAFSNFRSSIRVIPEEMADVREQLDEVMEILYKIHPIKKDKFENLMNAPDDIQIIMQIVEDFKHKDLTEDDYGNISQSLINLKAEAQTDEAKENIQRIINDYNIFMENIGFDELLAQTLREKINDLLEKGYFGQEKKKIDKEIKPKAKTPDNSQNQNSIRKTMRVLETDIDTFLSYVGELIVVGDMFNNLQKQVFEKYTEFEIIKEFRRVTGIFEQLSTNLQKSIMAIRKVPIRPLLMKVPRTVRDIADSENKKIDVDIQGDDIRIDKSLIDVIDGPLTHMVRNAADHGIESTIERKETGKDETGHIDVIVSMDDSKFTLKVKDDGAGIDRKAIRQKAIELGIINQNEDLSDDKIVDLIFSSGVSTAEKVTDISGRGVGMDVVKRNIEKIGGKIEIETNEGKGSTFSLILPIKVTTQIINGFLVEVANQPYVLPTNNIRQTTKVNRDEIMTTVGGNPFIRIHDEILPLKNLDCLLWNKNIDYNGKDVLITVTIENSTGKFALIVDNVLGVHDMVQKRIEGMSKSLEYVAGGALMGDGSIALILDIDEIKIENRAG